MQIHYHLRWALILPALLLPVMFGCAPNHYTIRQEHSVAFYLKLAQAKEVIFACSMDRYQYHPATPVDPGLWKVTVWPTADFDYFYIVDGVVTVPDCTLVIRDDFGSSNCVHVSNM